MKNLLAKYLLLCCYLFPQLASSQIPAWNDPITPTEARTFIQQVLWLSNYGRHTEDNPDERFTDFLSDSLRQAVRTQDNVWYRYDLYGAQIHRVDPPWVEVLTTQGADSRNWGQVKRFRLGKKEGKLYLIPQYNKAWNTTYVTAWQEAEEFPTRPATTEEKTAIRDDVLAYLDYRLPAAEPASWTREQLLGHWRIDSTYYFRAGEKVASMSLAEYLLLYDGKFYNVNESFRRYGGYFLDYPGWWGVKNGHLFTSDGIRVDLFAVEKVGPHRMVLKRYGSTTPVFLQLNNLPRKPFTASEPVALDHPGVDVVLQPIYNYTHLMEDTQAGIYADGLHGVVDSRGEEVLPRVYESITAAENEVFFYGKRNEIWYRINTTGEEVDSLPYAHHIYQATNDYIVVQNQEGRVGLVDLQGNVLVSFEYDMISAPNDRYFSIRKNGKLGLIDRSGKPVVPPLYDYLTPLENGMYEVRLSDRYGIIDPANGRYLIEPEYDNIYHSDNYYRTEQNGYPVFFDSTFQRIDPPRDYEQTIYLGDGYLGVEKSGKRGIITVAGEVQVPIEYDDVKRAPAGFAVQRGSRWGVVDHRGELIVPVQYEKLVATDEAIAVRKNGRWGVLDRNGRELLPTEYEALDLDHFSSSSDYCRVSVAGRQRLIDIKTGAFISAAHDKVHFPHFWSYGSEALYIPFEDNGRHGFLDDGGEVVFPAAYEQIIPINDDYALVKKDGQYGVIDLENRVIVPFIFEDIDFRVDHPLVAVEYEGYHGLIKNPVYVAE